MTRKEVREAKANFEISQTLKHFASFLFWLSLPNHHADAYKRDIADAARNHAWAVEDDLC
jgi:hypothetical protein